MIDSKDKDFEKEIRRIYEEDYIGQKLSVAKIREKYNYDIDIYYWFNKYGLKRRDHREKKLQYSCNSNYFEVIDTEDKAYWLGFIYADGYIKSGAHNYNKGLGISLSSIDKHHLEKFRDCIEGDMPIHEYNVTSGYSTSSKYCRIIIVDPKIAEDLINAGVIEHKTNVLTFPAEDILPENLRQHFIRGYFDGDGSINCENNPKNIIPQHKISFCGTDDILNGIMNELINKEVLSREYEFGKRKQGQIVSRLDFGGNRLTLKFCDYLYKDATIWLDRKYEKYKKLLDYVREIDDRKVEKECCVCGLRGISRTHLVWHGDGEYFNKIVCRRHYHQLRSKGKITKP